MKTDLYLRTVLTVIALCLLLLTINQLELFPKAHANGIARYDQDLNYLALPLNEDGSISVKLMNTERIEVDISDISTSDELNINLTEIGGSHVFGGQIPVIIED